MKSQTSAREKGKGRKRSERDRMSKVVHFHIANSE